MSLIKLPLWHYFQESFCHLLTKPLRSLLALLGILVGTASVVAMVSGGELATQEALKQFKTLGTDLLALSLSDNDEAKAGPRSGERLSVQAALEVYQLDRHIIGVAPYVQVFFPLRSNREEMHGNVLGVTPDFKSLVHIDMAEGRFISAVDGHGFFCVIGSQIAKQIEQQSLHGAVGQFIQIGGQVFQIVGVAQPWPENSFVYANLDTAIMVPIATSLMLSNYASINNMILRLQPGSNIDEIEHTITQFMAREAPNKKIFFRSAKTLIQKMSQQNEIFTVFLGLIGSISLIVGGIGVMNIMLVSVMERRSEIGIRLALGARGRDIRILFLSEAIILASLGGTLGVILGSSIAYIMSWVWHWEYIFFVWPVGVGLGVSIMTGLFFGYYPAYKAAQLDPIVALRAYG